MSIAWQVDGADVCGLKETHTLTFINLRDLDLLKEVELWVGVPMDKDGFVFP
jgi:hypothetical protein